LKVWGAENAIFEKKIMHSTPFARNAGQVGYVSANSGDRRNFRRVFDALGREVATRIGLEN
jgi:hypothetical protein